MKYKIGDSVIISKEFTVNTEGRFLNCHPKIAKIVKVQDTVSFGPAYSLEVDGERLSVMYWENDIDRIYDNDPENIWKIWGDQ